MSRIYWDTMLFVYLLEADPQFGPRVSGMYEEMMLREDRLCTSIFTVGEVLVGPQKRGGNEVVSRLKNYFNRNEIELIPFTIDTADLYSRIRAAHAVPPADAIHLASAAQSRVDLFLTNDRRLLKLNIPGITFIAGLDARLF
jgi:uncharacterized protein